MSGIASDSPATRFTWGHRALETEFTVAPDGTLGITRLARPDDPHAPSAGPAATLPVVEISAVGHGSGWSGPPFVDSALGARLHHRGHHATRDGDWHRLCVELQDPRTGLSAELLLSSPDGLPVLRSQVRLLHQGFAPLTVQSVSSLVLGGLPSPDVVDVHRARNDWLAECRWHHSPLRETVVDTHRGAHEHDSRARLAVAGRGSWPSDGHLPMGAITDRGTGRGVLWQIESAAGWRWHTGEYGGATYLALNGPTDAEHQWSQTLAPGDTFTTAAVAVALGSRSSGQRAESGAGSGTGSGSAFEGALAALTGYRRTVRRPHSDHTVLPVIFNDYMNTLMGDPTTERLLPLIDAASEAGAEYFCIDSGWYDDDAQGWWDSVGEWLPSARRFPGGGIEGVLAHIRSRGMVPGLWLEPEVVGVRSPVAASLPPAAFFQRGGVRVTEHGRHHLDLRHPAARAHLDRTVDRIVGEWGVGYLKLDYNITVSPGTDRDGRGGPAAPGAGLFGHTRAHLDWLSAVLDRHPGLVVENCASGGMRMDGASLAVAQLQSTSDQQDPLLYAAVAASAPTAVPPEQGAVWACPQPEHSDDEITFALAGALLGRIHLSGHLDRMTDAQRALVRGAVAVYKEIRPDLRHATAFWPLGLPGWTDGRLALGLRAPGVTYLTVWRRNDRASEHQELPVTHLAGRDVRVDILHPHLPAGATASWDPGRSALGVSLPRAPSAMLVRLTGTRRRP